MNIKAIYVNHMGNDLTIVNAARISFGNLSDTLTEKDVKLIDYLAKHKHFSPFEHCQLSVLIECPLYIRSQIHRHRTFAYNEVSRRYTEEDIQFYIPPQEDLRSQSKSNKQCSEGVIDKSSAALAYNIIKDAHSYAHSYYKQLISLGVSREQARGVLPQNLMTKFYMTGSLRNWAHFVHLRNDAHAQKEVQCVAQEIKLILFNLFPKASEALFKYVS